MKQKQGEVIRQNIQWRGSKTDSENNRISLHSKTCKLAQCSRNKNQCDEYWMYRQKDQWHAETYPWSGCMDKEKKWTQKENRMKIYEEECRWKNIKILCEIIKLLRY